MGQKIREEKDDKVEHTMWAWLMANKIVHRLGLLPKPYEDQLRSIKFNDNKDALHWQEDEEKYWQVVVKDVNSFIAVRDH
ncbi:hypothetical protein HK104_007382, partial [Borealophlyctis nickersoniae]